MKRNFWTNVYQQSLRTPKGRRRPLINFEIAELLKGEDIVKVTKSMGMRWDGHVLRVVYIPAGMNTCNKSQFVIC